MMLSVSDLQETNEFAHSKLSEELIYIQKLAAHLKKMTKAEREKKLANVKSWSFTEKGKVWLHHFDILDVLLDAILRGEVNEEGQVIIEIVQSPFPVPRNFTVSTLFFAIRSLTALIFSLKAKMQLVHTMNKGSNWESHHQDLSCISPDFPDILLIAEKSEQDLMQIYRWKGTLSEVAEIELTAEKLKGNLTIAEE